MAGAGGAGCAHGVRHAHTLRADPRSVHDTRLSLAVQLLWRGARVARGGQWLAVVAAPQSAGGDREGQGEEVSGPVHLVELLRSVGCKDEATCCRILVRAHVLRSTRCPLRSEGGKKKRSTRIRAWCGLAKRHLQRRLQPGGYFPDEHGALNVRVISAKDEPLLRVLNATPRSQKTNVNVVLARLEEVAGSLEQSADRAAKEDEEDQEAEVVFHGLTRRILRTGRCDVTINQYVLSGFTCSAGATTRLPLPHPPPSPVWERQRPLVGGMVQNHAQQSPARILEAQQLLAQLHFSLLGRFGRQPEPRRAQSVDTLSSNHRGRSLLTECDCAARCTARYDNTSP